MSEFILSDSDRQQLVELFLVEAEEVLGQFEALLLQLEKTPERHELLHEIFRAAHTLKGNASCLQFTELTGFAHVVEGTLDRLRNREIEPTPARISRLLDSVDVLRNLATRSIAGQCALTESEQSLLAALSMEEPSAEEPAAAPAAPAQEADGAAKPVLRSLRVDMDKLDRMLDLNGEITIARGRVHDLLAAGQPPEKVIDAVREVDRLSLNLQELVMSARLVPVGPSLRHFHRVVRDLASVSRKRVNLMIEGNEVEVDATVIEHLKDPITQMIRNAVDHGIETPDERVARGKPPAGTVRISASHDSGAVVIRISDDGRGLSETDIGRQARSRGIDTDRLSRQEVLGLIFQPGFSTAKRVTEISGRGVGMDVVLANVQSLRGTVNVSSQPGAGTTITMRLPLTVALIEGFAVAVGEEIYIIPVDAIVECIEMPRSGAREARGVLHLRGTPVPFVRLRDLFDLRSPLPARENAVIVQHEQRLAGIVVDELLGGRQTVMKPIGRMLRRAIGVAGSSILGNGRVALILDPQEIVRRAADRVPSTSAA